MPRTTDHGEAGADARARAATLLAASRFDAARNAIDEAAECEPDHPRLFDLRVGLALLGGDAFIAVRMLESGRINLTRRRRLLLALARMQCGQAVAAQQDLAAWSREEDCPPTARALLALLECERGNHEQALAALGHGQLNDSSPLPAIMRALIAADDHPLWADPGRRCRPLLDRSTSAAEQLSIELAQQPDLIPTLAAAQRYEPRADQIQLLRAAIAPITDQLEKPLEAMIAAAQLALLAGDRAEARRWAQRGLAHDPYSATLALLLNELDGHSEHRTSNGLQTLATLQNAADAHGQYADVRRALVMRCEREGLHQLAIQHALQWVEQSPGNALAQQTLKETAA